MLGTRLFYCVIHVPREVIDYHRHALQGTDIDQIRGIDIDQMSSPPLSALSQRSRIRGFTFGWPVWNT